MNGVQGEEGCKGATAERAACNTQACPSWTTWSAYGACSVSCGGGTQTRGRQCDNGIAGQPGCDGMATQERYCNGQVCPHWSAWAEYGACSKSCDGGVATRSRVCLNGDAGMAGCDGDVMQLEPCNSAVSLEKI